MAPPAAALAAFSPAVRDWFLSSIGEPTAVQAAAWPAIARGAHVLATAPTGSGKTLTAFLYAIDRFATGEWQTGRTRVLYVSPLKALNNDIQRNLIAPLASLREREALPALRVAVRSGDTPQSERQRLLRRPPDILITTPESLALMLTTVRGREALSHVETVIFDEVHAVADNRRGVSLAVSAERLVELTGDALQRIALSATVEPLAQVARFVAGHNAARTPRPIEIINPSIDKALELTVRYPDEAARAAEQGEPIWDALAERFRDITEANRSTLFFTNSRKLAEKVTLKINDASHHPGPLAWAHHGSLARDIRSEVERRLKAGELRAIVATSSLEMGIDIGDLDEVVMVQSPPGIAQALQRLGRAGHQVNAVSRGTLFPVHDHDFLEAAVLTRATLERDLEPLRPVDCPLDMLAQFIISCTATETRTTDDLFALLRRAEPYRRLSREAFDRVLEQLAGRYSGARVRALEPRIEYDRLQGTVSAKKSAVFAFYNAGGSIPDRGYYQIRHGDGGAQIGELDEEFVWEAKIGDVFSLGTQHWQVQRITHNDVFVKPARPVGIAPPFWRAEKLERSAHFADRIAAFLAEAEQTLQHAHPDELVDTLQTQHHFDAGAATKLVDYLSRQRESTGSALPHSDHVVLERMQSGPDGYRGPELQQQWVIHTVWGGQANRPYALALGAAWQQTFDESPEVHSDNDAIIVLAKANPTPEAVMALVEPHNLDALLRAALESSGFFGARFREVCGRFLLLPRQKFNQRLPLWMSRLQAKKLMSATRDFSDFPVMLETWRTCLQDEFDLGALRQHLGRLADGSLLWSYAETDAPSPFARNLSYEQIAPLVYADDTPEHAGPSQLDADLIAEAVRNAAVRPPLNPVICAEFVAKRQRSHPDYRPETDADWRDWVRERVLLPEAEWWDGWQGQPDAHDDRLVVFSAGQRRWVCHLEQAHALVASGLAADATPSRSALPALEDARDSLTQACEILSFYGPLRTEQVVALLPSVPYGLFEDGRLVGDVRVQDDEALYTLDAENLDIILRWQRAANRPAFETRPATALPDFLARWHGFGKPPTADNTVDALDRLRGYRAPVSTVLDDCLAARLPGLSSHQLDDSLREHAIRWRGHSRERISLHYDDDTDLLYAPSEPTDDVAALRAGFADPAAGYSFNQVRDQLQATAPEDDLDAFNARWWDAVWAGVVTADAVQPLRQGALAQYRLTSAPSAHHRARAGRRISGRRALQNARAAAVGWPGVWRLSPQPTVASNPLDQLERARERVYLLLDRYGVVNRDLVNRECDDGREPMAWRALFQALRVMELAGEVVQGLFFDELAGPQFASPQALHLLRRHPSATGSFWCNALDPVSPCGLGLDWPELPQRRAQNALAFHDGALALVIERAGKQLRFLIEPDAPALGAVLAPLAHLAARRRVEVQTINDTPAVVSPYRAALERHLDCHSDHKALTIEAPHSP